MRSYLIQIDKNSNLRVEEIERAEQFAGYKIKKRKNGQPHFRRVLTQQFPLFEGLKMMVKNFTVIYAPVEQAKTIYNRLYVHLNRDRVNELQRKWYNENKSNTPFQNMIRTQQFVKTNKTK